MTPTGDISHINRFWKYDDRDKEWKRYLLPLFRREYPTHPKTDEWCLILNEAYMYVNYKPKPKFKWIGEAIIENADMRSDYLWQMNLDRVCCDYDVKLLNGHKVLVMSISDKNLGTIHLPLITKNSKPPSLQASKPPSLQASGPPMISLINRSPHS